MVAGATLPYLQRQACCVVLVLYTAFVVPDYVVIKDNTGRIRIATDLGPMAMTLFFQRYDDAVVQISRIDMRAIYLPVTIRSKRCWEVRGDVLL